MNEINVAVHPAKQAGNLLRESFKLQHRISYKGVINMVTEIDKESERLITEILGQSFPDYGFLGEEGSLVEGNGESRWIVDPIDGTTNYAHSYPLFAISIALEVKGEVVLGVVYNPLLDEMFTSQKGKGSFVNGEAIHTTDNAELSKAMLASGFPYDVWSSPINNCPEWERFIKHTVSVRCDGVASLDLAYVAAGRIDGYWELNLEPWDMAAGALIVQEAGGQVSLSSGKNFSIYNRNILASNGSLHRSMLEMLNS